MNTSEYLVINSAKAQRHPLIRRFVGRVATATAGGGVLDFSALQARDFQEFWPYLIIYRQLPEEREFRVILFGTHLVTMHGREWTGKRLCELDIGETAAGAIREMNDKMLSGETPGAPLFNSGKINLDAKHHLDWHQVRLPLGRGGAVNEVLVCMCSEHEE